VGSVARIRGGELSVEKWAWQGKGRKRQFISHRENEFLFARGKNRKEGEYLGNTRQAEKGGGDKFDMPGGRWRRGKGSSVG